MSQTQQVTQTVSNRSSSEPKPNRLGTFLRDYRQRTLTPLNEIAAEMERYPSSVAKLETQADHAWTLYSLQRYAAAVGARVGVVLVFPGEEHKPGVILGEPPPDWRSKWAAR